MAGAGGTRQRIRTSGRARSAITAPLGFINSANAATAAYRVTLKYRVGDSIFSAQQTVVRTDSAALPGTPMIVAIGQAPVVSVVVEEYAPPQVTAEFME